MDSEPQDTYEATPLVEGAYVTVDDWETKIEKKIATMQIEVHLTAAGTLIAVAGLVLVGRTIAKLIQTQGQIANVLSSAGLIAPQPTRTESKAATDTTSEEPSAPASGVKYARPEKQVDTASAGPVDEALLNELDSVMQQDPTRDTPI